MKKSTYQIKSIRYNDEPFDYIQMLDTCVTLYRSQSNEVLLVKQYRPVFDAYFLELPGGSHESNETIEETAIREFIEETGLIPRQVYFVMSVILSIGSSTEKAHIFQVNELISSRNDISEKGIELHWVNCSEIPKMIKNGEIVDAKTIVALQRLIV